MDIKQFIKDWILVGNSYDTEKYLAFYTEDAVLDDPSVGRKFSGKNGIKEYFESYFIGYKTQTRKVDLVVKNTDQAHLEVEFRGDFPEGKIGGTFDFTFKEGKIALLSADLL
ncbi:nuclear transport factor 2 family protein [Pedobacter hartonius]|uniref:SnoaL-like domain-containing protein n=1 Tax=Pedobacter hartonius TaxID=425514 RepID=A0A1H4CMB8_9SPHI|nr:nuclear transport factor 2 family protein [Pedobacter hartonius]SEA61601.1 SnoaL-like domain-containing protein [Pedobacter hartonius]